MSVLDCIVSVLQYYSTALPELDSTVCEINCRKTYVSEFDNVRPAV